MLRAVPGPVISPVDAAFMSPLALAQFLNLLAEFGTLGSAVAAFNVLPENRSAGLRLFLFGDPRCRFPMYANSMSIRSASAAGSLIERRRVQLLGRLGTLLGIVDQTQSNVRLSSDIMLNREHLEELAHELGSSLRSLQMHLLNGGATFDSALPLAASCDKFVLELMQRICSPAIWAPRAPLIFADGNLECRHCGASARKAHGRFRNGFGRYIESCRSCGLTFDGPDEEPFFEATIQSDGSDILIGVDAQSSGIAVNILINIIPQGVEPVSLLVPAGANAKSISLASVLGSTSERDLATLKGFVEVQVICCHQLLLTIVARRMMYCDVTMAHATPEWVGSALWRRRLERSWRSMPNFQGTNCNTIHPPQAELDELSSNVVDGLMG